MKRNLILVFVALCFFSFCPYGNAQENTQKRMSEIPEDVDVLFIPGFRSEGKEYTEEKRIIEKIFPKSKVLVWHWNANKYWFDALERVDSEAATLTLLVEIMPKEQRERLILIGHSLGGRIVIRTMAKLDKENKENKEKLKIKQGIFLGTAIPNDDSDVKAALDASLLINVNLYCREDAVLTKWFRAAGDGNKLALGAYGISFLYSSNSVMDVPRIAAVPSNEQHCAVYYLNELQKVFEKEKNNFQKTGSSKLIVPDSATIPIVLEKIKELEHRDFCRERDGKVLDSFRGWVLVQSSKQEALCHILDPNNNLRASGEPQGMKDLFEKIKTFLKTIQ